MKHSAALSSLRALSRSGLSAESFIPAALEALHRVVPSYRNLFDWTDSAGNLIRYYFEGPIDHRVAAHYFEEFHNRREGEVMPQFRQAITGRALVRSADELDHPAFFRSALYNEIWRPQRLHSRIEAIVRSSRGEPLGSLVLYREPGDARFTGGDEQLLALAAGYVARGLEAGLEASAPGAYAEQATRHAALTLGARGELLHLSSEALKLLLLTHGGVTPDAVSRQPRREDFGTLNLLWQHHERGRGLSREGLSLRIENTWGCFAYESQPLQPLQPGELPLVQVAIHHHEPAIVAVRRALDGLPLSPAQREVCALLREGQSQTEIADTLGIAPTTVADHVRKIYAKLEVHSANGLRERIRALGGAAAA